MISKQFFIKSLFLFFVCIAGVGKLQAQTASSERVYQTQLNEHDIATYELAQAPVLVEKWLNSTDAQERHWIEVELFSFNHIDEPTAIKIKNIGMNLIGKSFSHDEIRLVSLKKIHSFYVRYGETENASEAMRDILALKQKLEIQ